MSQQIKNTRGKTTADEPVPYAGSETELVRLRAALRFMLSSPYEGNTAWSITLACNELEHPSIRDDRRRECYCGIRKAPPS